MTSKKPSSARRVLLLESITASGLPRTAAPESLWREATAMRDALAHDLGQVPDLELQVATTPQDDHSPDPGWAVTRYPPWSRWQELAAASGAVLPVAPESGGELLALTVMALAGGRRCLGCHPAAIRIAGSKRATACVLALAGVPIVPTWRLADAPAAEASAAWVVKPDDGAGGMDTRRLWRSSSLATTHPAVAPGRGGGVATGAAGAGRVDPDATRATAAVGCLVVQPFIEGPSGSVFAFGRGDSLRLLASSTQHIEWREDRPRLTGLGVNDPLLPWPEAQALVARVAEAIPGLDGFWGLDFILGHDGIRVLEVNLRPTSTYPALARSLGWNPARLLLGRPAPLAATRPLQAIHLGFE